MMKFLLNNKRIAVNVILSVLLALSMLFGISAHKNNKKLSERLELAQNNIEAYQGALNGSQQALNVLKLDMTKLSQQNDALIQKIDSVRKKNNIKAKEITTAATQTQTILVNKSKGVRGDIIEVLKDTIYKDTLQYNDLTKIYYTIGKDSVNMILDVENTQYLYVYRHKEYVNKKSFFKRLFTLDFKKKYSYKYDIVNTNDLFKEDDIRIIEKED